MVGDGWQWLATLVVAVTSPSPASLILAVIRRYKLDLFRWGQKQYLLALPTNNKQQQPASQQIKRPDKLANYHISREKGT